MATIDYFLTGDHDEARRHFFGALESMGFRMSEHADGSFRVERGSQTATFWLGAFAGKAKQHFVFKANFFTQDGLLVARISRESTGGMMAGAIGVARANKVFAEVDQAIGQTMTTFGILANVQRA